MLVVGARTRIAFRVSGHLGTNVSSHSCKSLLLFLTVNSRQTWRLTCRVHTRIPKEKQRKKREERMCATLCLWLPSLAVAILSLLSLLLLLLQLLHRISNALSPCFMLHHLSLSFNSVVVLICVVHQSVRHFRQRIKQIAYRLSSRCPSSSSCLWPPLRFRSCCCRIGIDERGPAAWAT